jgi:hypothetical protein
LKARDEVKAGDVGQVPVKEKPAPVPCDPAPISVFRQSCVKGLLFASA